MTPGDDQKYPGIAFFPGTNDLIAVDNLFPGIRSLFADMKADNILDLLQINGGKFQDPRRY